MDVHKLIQFFHMYENASLFWKVVFLLNENVGIGSIITLASGMYIEVLSRPPQTDPEFVEATQIYQVKRVK